MSRITEKELAVALRGCLDSLRAIAESQCSNGAHKSLAENWDIPEARRTLARYDAQVKLRSC